MRHSARGWGWGQSSHISPVSGQQERTEAGGTRRTGDASLAQTSPDLSSCGRGREASLQLRRLQEEEGRKRQGGVTGGGVPKTEAIKSRIKETEKINRSRIPTGCCVQKPDRNRRCPITGREGHPRELQREPGTQERQRSRKQGVLGEKVVQRGDESARSGCRTPGARGKPETAVGT